MRWFARGWDAILVTQTGSDGDMRRDRPKRESWCLTRLSSMEMEQMRQGMGSLVNVWETDSNWRVRSPGFAESLRGIY